jgi:hypothetical protein
VAPTSELRPLTPGPTAGLAFGFRNGYTSHHSFANKNEFEVPMRSIILIAAICLGFSASAPSSAAAEPKAIALSAVVSLFVQHDIDEFKAFVDRDAIQGDHKAGSAIAKIDNQRPKEEELKAVELSQVIFFRATDIDRLSRLYPDDLWPRVAKHIGGNQGMLIKLELTGAMADRAKSAGKDPNSIAMMTFIVDSKPEPKIVHIDDN